MNASSATCETLYLGWDAPLLPRAVATLAERHTQGNRWDLGASVCVLPSARGIRRFRELLVERAQADQLDYTPPRLVTLGQLPERLYRARAPVASDFEQTLAWARVLRSFAPEKLQPLVPVLPAPHPLGPWLELAGTIRRLHADLASERLGFEDVVEAADTENDRRRWKLLSELFQRYLAELQEAQLVDPHWARREAIQQGSCRTEHDIVLVGTSDLSEALVAMLRSLGDRVLALVAAPPNESSRFDEFGSVRTAAWLDHELPLEDHHLLTAGDIADSATAVVESVSDFSRRYSPREVTVGVTDESQVGPLEMELRGCGFAPHRQLGWTVGQTAIGRLLSLTTAHLARRTWQSLATLVRHADVHDWITAQMARESEQDVRETESLESQWLVQLDQLLAEHYPVHLAEPLPPKAQRAFPLAVKVRDCVESWLSEFAGRQRSIARWGGTIERWLASLYGEAPAEPSAADEHAEEEPHAPAETDTDPGQYRTGMALHLVRRLLGQLQTLNGRLDLEVSGAVALEMFAGRAAALRVGQPLGEDQVEIAGWLDLALDDAPALVVAGLNHPFVPEAVTSDPFLPGGLRTRLRMADNDRRYARDAHAMQLMLSTRDAVRFVVGRTAADGSPTPPSRLLAASPAADIARRLRRLLSKRRPAVASTHRWNPGPKTTRLPVPTLPPAGTDPSREITTMSVTAFRDYLACPYRFYLRHVLKFRPVDDSAGELAANQFGDLVHGALERFGMSPEKNETDPARIEARLIEHLHQHAEEHYGDSASTAVRLQVAQARRRLKVAAGRQAERIAEGWYIHATEQAVDEKLGAAVEVDGRRMGLRGRFDRIDHHRQTGRWAILDYKTHGHRPEKKHLQSTENGKQWVDLQLPLYRLMIPFLGIEAEPSEVQLGYFNVSEKDEETGINIAEFSEDQMEEALQLIHDCIRGIWAGRFEPTQQRVPFDDYGMILQTGVSQRLLDAADAAADSEVSG